MWIIILNQVDDVHVDSLMTTTIKIINLIDNNKFILYIYIYIKINLIIHGSLIHSQESS